MTSVSDRAHARDYAEMDAEYYRRNRRSARAYRVLDALSPVTVSAWRTLGPKHELVQLYMMVTDALLDLTDHGLDLDPEMEAGILDIIFDREAA